MFERKAFSGIMLALLLANMLVLAFNIQPVKGNIITVPDDYPTIQEALNAASGGDTVFVRNGTYYENVVVAKAVSLIGENAEGTVIDGGGLGSVVMIAANGVNVSGFTIRNSGTDYGGIMLESVIHFNINILGNNITNNYSGIWFDSTSNSNISGNNITTNNQTGVYLGFSSNYNTVSENNIKDNWDGVHLYVSSNNTVSGNNITNGGYSGVSLTGSSNNTFLENNITNNWGGINLLYSYNNTVLRNNITNNAVGIYLWSSSNYNTISGNNITTNNQTGIFLEDSSNNKLFHNNFVDNAQQVNIPTSGNASIWDDGYPSGGNFWSNYVDVDLYSGPYQNETGGDDIWDHPYVIDGYNQDHYPIVPEFPSAAILPIFMAISLLGLILAKKRIRLKTV